MKVEKNYKIQILRAIAIFAVVFIHTCRFLFGITIFYKFNSCFCSNFDLCYYRSKNIR